MEIEVIKSLYIRRSLSKIYILQKIIHPTVYTVEIIDSGNNRQNALVCLNLTMIYFLNKDCYLHLAAVY